MGRQVCGGRQVVRGIQVGRVRLGMERGGGMVGGKVGMGRGGG